MAIKWAINSGNWSSAGTWNDGVLPTTGDTVYANGKTISFNNEINIGEGWLRNDANAEYGIVAGGTFSSTSAYNSEEVTANVYGYNNVICLYMGTSGAKTVNGNLDSDEYGAVVRYDTAHGAVETCGNLTINGNVKGRIDSDSTLDDSYIYLTINGDWEVQTSDYAFRRVRTNWYNRRGTFVNINGKFIFNKQWSNALNTSFYVSILSKFVLNSTFSVNGQTQIGYLSLGTTVIDIYNLSKIVNWSIGTVFDGANSYITNSQGEIIMIGINMINYPAAEDVKAGVEYGLPTRIGQLDIALTPEQLQRISNCVTPQILQATIEQALDNE